MARLNRVRAADMPPAGRVAGGALRPVKSGFTWAGCSPNQRVRRRTGSGGLPSPWLRLRARSSAVEHSLHTGGVTGSNPVAPTMLLKDLGSFAVFAKSVCHTLVTGTGRMATLRKRGNRWQAQVRLQGHAPVSHSFLAKSDAAAWARRTEARLEQAAGPTDLRIMDRTTLGDLFQRYRSQVTAAKRGGQMEAIKLACFLRHPMALLPLSKVAGTTFAAYRDERLQLVSGETVRREFTILHHVLEVARREWSLPFIDNPVSLVKRPAPNRPRDRRPTPLEVSSLLAAAAAGRSKYLVHAIILAKETGMRRGELLSYPSGDGHLFGVRLT